MLRRDRETDEDASTRALRDVDLFYANLGEEGGTPEVMALLRNDLQAYADSRYEGAKEAIGKFFELWDSLAPEFGQGSSLALAEFLLTLDALPSGCSEAFQAELLEEDITARAYRVPPIAAGDDPAARLRVAIHEFVNEVYRTGLTRSRVEDLWETVCGFGESSAVWAHELAVMFADTLNEVVDELDEAPAYAWGEIVFELLAIDAICANPGHVPVEGGRTTSWADAAMQRLSWSILRNTQRSGQVPDA